MTRAADGPGGTRGGRHRAECASTTTGPQTDPPGTTGRPSNAALAREHELARMRAKLMDPETAARELAERLTFAHVNAGKPALGALGEAVHYSKATLSKVFAGKMVPSWPLVENLAVALRVPPQTVVQEWLHLWTAANTLRRGTDAPGTAEAESTRTGYTCPKCGSWVVDTALHTGWHMQIEPSGRAAPASESIGGWNAQSREISLIQEALAPDGE
ncbi:helix-turn-helix domain-containing protein [Amorphoplanes digitatis]|uniref:HTH cro/C1-type domain-containing protein n=2 Tax=Actinoplanes digitatis TaxID=1868 RepID=A0A7W7MU33_9ACTN|nr:helix-turn-helix domain-containing protein [Actinoplanes digitatis]MBB4767031.1 hypothetical protein [Actinoplanes digitatis]